MRSIEKCIALTKADMHMDVRWRPHEEKDVKSHPSQEGRR